MDALNYQREDPSCLEQAIAFHGSGYRTLKEFYTLQVLPG
jgi:hypothetical protein